MFSVTLMIVQGKSRMKDSWNDTLQSMLCVNVFCPVRQAFLELCLWQHVNVFWIISKVNVSYNAVLV